MKLSPAHEQILINSFTHPTRPPPAEQADFDHLVELEMLEAIPEGYMTSPMGRLYLKHHQMSAAPDLQQWRGQVLLDIDVFAQDDDSAMEEITQHVTKILNGRCSIAERRVVLRQFFGELDAPWQSQTMAANGAQLVDRALQVAHVVSTPGWEDALQPDLHIHRQVLEEAIDHALRHAYQEGRRMEMSQNKPNVDRAVEVSESPERVATLLRAFASRYDAKGWADEANLLRDAATTVEDVLQDTAG